MKQSIQKLGSRIASNWQSGVTVALISIPLSVSLAVASQTSPIVGIITAIWAGLVASILGGSHFNIVGPAGALSGILATYSLAHGAPSLALLAIVSGCFMFIAYLLKLEKYLVFIPASTVHGFTLGVALLLALGQLNNALGISGLVAHASIFENIKDSLSNLNLISWNAIILTVVSIAFLLIIKKYGSKKVPGPIILAPIGILIGYLASKGMISFDITTLGSKFPNMTGSLFIMPDLSAITYYKSLISTALAVALVGILETMLSAKIADGITNTKYDKRKEMFGLSIANIVSGLFGGLPATGVLARTALNAKTGATNKMSATINSLSIMVISLLFLKYFVYIPMPVIAAILIYICINMIEVHHFKRMFAYDKKGFVIALIVAFITVYEDPIFGILIGTCISLLLLVEKISRGQCELTLNEDKQMTDKFVGDKVHNFFKQSDTLVYTIKGELVYLNGQAHLSRFEHQFHGYNNVIIKLRSLHLIDMDGIDTLEEIIGLVKSQNKNIYITGVEPMIMDMLNDAEHFQALIKDGKVLPKTSDALRSLGFEVNA